MFFCIQQLPIRPKAIWFLHIQCENMGEAMLWARTVQGSPAEMPGNTSKSRPLQKEV